MKEYGIYLRKSRADIEAESHGEGETLAKHERQLFTLAKKKDLPITKVYREVVSGETIAARPEMQSLLADVEAGLFSGILVMEIERLARGDTMDQGFVAQAFKFSDTKIITPSKIYDPNNEFDEEYFEFGLFMSRREYKTITRRMQRGRCASVADGKYIGSKPPYGYTRKKLEHTSGWSLEIVPEQADIVKLIYDLYINHGKGPAPIAKELDRLGYLTPRGEHWSIGSIAGILNNPVHAGYVFWKTSLTSKKVIDGKLQYSRRKNPDGGIMVKGLHDPIVPEEIWNQAKRIREGQPRPRLNVSHIEVRNPLAGILKCGLCGHSMTRRHYEKQQVPDSLLCVHPSCHNVSSYLPLVEEELLVALKEWWISYKLQLKKNNHKQDNPLLEIQEKALLKARNELADIEKQKSNLHDFLERGIYTVEVFIERSKVLSEREKITNNRIVQLIETGPVTKKIVDYTPMLPKIEYVLSAYSTLDTPSERNKLLKTVLKKVTYVKLKGGRHSGFERSFVLDIFPKLPDD